MLAILKIRNIALIDALEVEFGAGLNLLTGETGSGKSIIVDSLAALTGERVSADLIKDGAETATVEGVFEIDRSSMSGMLENSGIEVEEPEIIVRRELSRSGRNRVYLNDQIVTAALLRRVAPHLADIHGQGEQFTLFDPASHRALLDEFASAGDLLVTVADAFEEFTSVRNELAALKKDEAEKLQLIDILQFQVTEIERAALKPAEMEQLEDEKRRLNNVEKLSALSNEAFELLYESDASTMSTFDRAARNLEEIAQFDQRFREHARSIESARAVIDDLAIAVRDFRSALEFSPERLEEIESRLAEITRVTRKYGGTVESAIEHLETSKRRLENIETADLREKELTRELAAKREQYLAAARALSSKRGSAAKLFAKEVEKQLRPLALEKARFEVRVDTPVEPADDDFTQDGLDRVEFFFSANVGESTKPLARVASGGELSRVMLALKTLASTDAPGKTLIFDEVDAGIGGAVADVVGSRLQKLGETFQVLCITHLPQIAARADRQFAITKAVRGSRTVTSVAALDAAQRERELARMIGGDSVTPQLLQSAQEMITARQAKGERTAKGESESARTKASSRKTKRADA